MIQLPTSGGAPVQPPHHPSSVSASVGVSKEKPSEQPEEKGASNLLSDKPQEKEQLNELEGKQVVTEHGCSEPMDTSGSSTVVSSGRGRGEGEGECVRVSDRERDMSGGGSSGGSHAMNKQQEKKAESGSGEGGQQGRVFVTYHISSLTETPKEDLPDEFYRVTIDDVLVMQRDLKAKATSFDAPLQTRVMRQLSDGAAQLAEKYSKVCWEDRGIQGTSLHVPHCLCEIA